MATLDEYETTAISPGFPGATARSVARRGALSWVIANCRPGVCEATSKRRTAAAPSNPTYRYWPLSERASLLDSLPINTDWPITPVPGLIGVMLLPLLPALLGTLA